VSGQVPNLSRRVQFKTLESVKLVLKQHPPLPSRAESTLPPNGPIGDTTAGAIAPGLQRRPQRSGSLSPLIISSSGTVTEISGNEAPGVAPADDKDTPTTIPAVSLNVFDGPDMYASLLTALTALRTVTFDGPVLLMFVSTQIAPYLSHPCAEVRHAACFVILQLAVTPNAPRDLVEPTLVC
jgi:hypothetical protein